ncbi:MAG: DNA repair protein RecO [Mangrovicoccus sp.]|nr:DNA repair protein RecO [Mangrovicoccus sp.]
MDWSDSGTILATRRHGENAALVEVFTLHHGRHAGIVRGGAGRRRAPELQPGTRVAVSWRARLSEHLGAFTLETERSRAALLMQDRLGLAGVSAICALSLAALPERAPYPDLQAQTETLFDLIAHTPAWPLAYLQWEMRLLETMGFGLDLSVCAVTGTAEDLTYISPKTGRAVSRAGAGEWADRLLPLPECLRGLGPAPDDEILQALQVTGQFLARYLDLPIEDLPAARGRLIAALERHSAAVKSN